jgi:ribosomal protein L18E
VINKLKNQSRNNNKINSAKVEMLIKLNDIILIYEKILEDINIDYVSVVIYSAVDIDSLCSLKILSVIIYK